MYARDYDNSPCVATLLVEYFDGFFWKPIRFGCFSPANPAVLSTAIGCAKEFTDYSPDKPVTRVRNVEDNEVVWPLIEKRVFPYIIEYSPASADRWYIFIPVNMMVGRSTLDKARQLVDECKLPGYEYRIRNYTTGDIVWSEA